MTGDGIESVELHASEGVHVSVEDWESRAATTRKYLAADGFPASDLTDVLRTFTFSDDGARTWCYDGEHWWQWDGTAWIAGHPDGLLSLRPFTMDVAIVAPEPRAAGVEVGLAEGANEIEIDGQRVVVAVERFAHGVRLIVRVAAPQVARDILESSCKDFELSSPGDTRVRAENHELCFTRTVVEPSSARDAAHELAKAVLVFSFDPARGKDPR